jgi:hypothetical protein
MVNCASLSDLLLVGTAAGVSDALFTTPCDVTRVRMQSIPRPGESTYMLVCIRDCAKSIYQQKAISGFFRGSKSTSAGATIRYHLAGVRRDTHAVARVPLCQVSSNECTCRPTRLSYCLSGFILQNKDGRYRQ